jgi:hypothetical protein
MVVAAADVMIMTVLLMMMMIRGICKINFHLRGLNHAIGSLRVNS